MKKYSKKEAVKIVISCAKRYQDELAGRALLFLCMDEHKQVSCVEFTFHPRHFMHLTGLKTSTSDRKEMAAVDFYDRCLNHKLSMHDFEFSKDGTTHMKLDVLKRISFRTLSARMIGDYNKSRPYLQTEKLAGNTTACVGFVVDKIDGQYVPNTILRDNIQNNIANCVTVIGVYRRQLTEQQYSECTYQAEKIDWEEIQYPEPYQYLSTLKVPSPQTAS